MPLDLPLRSLLSTSRPTSDSYAIPGVSATVYLCKSHSAPSPSACTSPPPADARETCQKLFQELPTELRLKIWALSLPGPRVVSIRCGPRTTLLPGVETRGAAAAAAAAHDSSPSRSWVTGCTSPSRLPASLHVCAESRAEALKTYRHCFGWARRRGQVVFDPAFDVLYFGPRDGYMVAESQFHTCMSMCDPRELAAVRRVAVDDSLSWIGDMYSSMTAASLTVAVIRELAARMPSLRELVFVASAAAADPAAARERMSRQIQAAFDVVRRQLCDWRPPQWRIAHLSASSDEDHDCFDTAC